MGNVDKDKKTDDTRVGTTTRLRIIHNGRDNSGHENEDDDNGVMCDVMTITFFSNILAAIYRWAMSASIVTRTGLTKHPLHSEPGAVH